jgi:putative hemolysin
VIEIEWLLLVLPLTLALDLLTVAAREGLLHTSLPRLLTQREQLETGILKTIRLVQGLPRLQASLSLTRLLLRFALAGILYYLLVNQWGVTNFWVVFGLLLVGAVVLFGLEWVVQVIVLQDTLSWALRMTPYARLLVFGLTPLVALPLSISGELEHIPDSYGTGMVTEDDLRVIVDAGQEEGLLEQEERKMIHSIFELGNTLVREIMVPRIDVLALDVDTELPVAVDAFLESGYSRVPVYTETVDHVEGLLYAKDLLRVWREGEQLASLRELLRPAYFVPEAKKVDELLTEMQSQRVHMAIVVDEYGGVAGLVTLEDIVEEIIGEVQDEYDLAEESPYEPLEEGGYIFLGRVDLDDFNEIVTANLPKDEADTLGGYIYSRVGRVPNNGERILVDNLVLTVEQVSGRRIRKVRVQTSIPGSSPEEVAIHVD